MFIKAIPVFAKGEEASLNYPLTLCAKLDCLDNTKMYVSAFSFYRLLVNGNFVCMGPARTARGYARVDEIDLSKYGLEGQENSIELQVIGYNCGSLSTARQTSFVVCEVRRGDEVVLYTGRDFDAYLDYRRIRECDRFSAQRHFGELWRIEKKDFMRKENRVELKRASNAPKYIARSVPQPTYDMINADGYASFGSFENDESLPCRMFRTSFDFSGEWGKFAEDEICAHPYRWVQKQRKEKKSDGGEFPIRLVAGEYVTVDMKRIEAGFICWSGRALKDADVVVAYSENCPSDDFAFTEINCQNVIEYFAEEGVQINKQSFEPYTCKIALLMVKSGEIELSSFGIRTYEFDRSRFLKREVRDPEFRRIYEAAMTTFAHNAVDLYSDCPSRERAGWLCDSYFTGKAEYFLTGASAIEDAFLENYRLYENDGKLPAGVLPMCYPADEHNNNNFIPQWDMWYVLEVNDYLTNRRKDVDKEIFRNSVYGVVEFLEKYENADGLLQNLPGWNFVEWSTANEWVQDVNYPTNFLYAQMLRAVGALYNEVGLLEKAERIAERTKELAFDGEFFVDNAVLDESGALCNTKNMSEAGQYYALLFGNVELDKPQYATLKKNLHSGFADFDPNGRSFVPVNAFIGFYLRIVLLMKLGERELLGRDIKSFFGGMVESTGTLWEYKQRVGSHDHGFASLAALAITFVEEKR